MTMFRRVGVLGVRLRPQSGDRAFPVPCGSCTACLLERSRQHAVRCSHERELHERACFVTLTYDEDHIPYANSLWKDDFRGFVRRLRAAVPGVALRFLACGEYGARTSRPHYHFILFGFDFAADRRVSGRRGGEDVYFSPLLAKLWPVGRSEIGSATFESAAYVARYVSKKLGPRALGDRESEFLLMSLKPGLGVPWIAKNWEHVYARDSVVVRGVEARPPRMYDKWLSVNHPEVFARVKRARELVRLPPGEDPDDRSSRWDAMEEVLLAQLNRFSREVDV